MFNLYKLAEYCMMGALYSSRIDDIDQACVLIPGKVKVLYDLEIFTSASLASVHVQVTEVL